MQNSNDFAVAANWRGTFDEGGIQDWAENLRRELRSETVSLGLVFMTPQFFPKAVQTLELLRVHAQIPLVVGCSSKSLIAGEEEIEGNAGLVLGLYFLPGTQLKTHHFTQEQVDESNGPGYWHQKTGLSSEQTNGWLVFADPFHLDAESWLRSWDQAYAPAAIIGGLASGDYSERLTQVYLNGDVFEEGGVAVSFGGNVELASLISQGCTPIGETWTITKVEGNLIQQIGNRPAYEILLQSFNSLSPEEQKKATGNLFVGLVVNEYLEEFRRGDFLIRNLLGADPKSGAIAVGALPRAGQTIQFQRRDAAAATEDIMALLQRSKTQLAGRPIYGACLCCCNGRGQNLFGYPNHDTQHIQKELGPIGLTGFFCNGEIGPVGERSFLHGYTASLALFVEKTRRSVL